MFGRASEAESFFPACTLLRAALIAAAAAHVCLAQYDPQMQGKGRTMMMPGKGREERGAASTGPSRFEARVAPGTPDGAQRPLVYNHVAKTGGTFVKNVLVNLFGADKAWSRSASITSRGSRPAVRDRCHPRPLDYYLSLWRFSSGGTLDRVIRTVPEIRQHMGKDSDSGYSSPQDIQRFRHWVAGLSSEHLSLFTARFWFSYFREGNPCKPHLGEICGGKRSKYETLRHDIDHDLTGVELHDIADCWLRTEQLDTDLKACLERYESDAGISLDWKLYDEVKRRVVKNDSGGSKNKSCEDFYDGATKQLVLDKDAHLVRLFGYDSCCSSRGGSADRSAAKTEL